jgi:hypothetical protein
VEPHLHIVRKRIVSKKVQLFWPKIFTNYYDKNSRHLATMIATSTAKKYHHYQTFSREKWRAHLTNWREIWKMVLLGIRKCCCCVDHLEGVKTFSMFSALLHLLCALGLYWAGRPAPIAVQVHISTIGRNREGLGVRRWPHLTKGWGRGLLFLGQGGGVLPFLDRKKEQIVDNSVKRSILTTLGATKAQKCLKRG